MKKLCPKRSSLFLFPDDPEFIWKYGRLKWMVYSSFPLYHRFHIKSIPNIPKNVMCPLEMSPNLKPWSREPRLPSMIVENAETGNSSQQTSRQYFSPFLNTQFSEARFGDLGLSENRAPLGSLVNHHVPCSLPLGVKICYTTFSNNPM